MIAKAAQARLKETTDGRDLVNQILRSAIDRGASDVHVEPTADGHEIRLRVDGLLETTQILDSDAGRSVVGRLMVMAHLLTYRMDVPQEGKASLALRPDQESIDLRVSVMPTTHGMRGAVRLPADVIQPMTLEQLGLPK